MTKIELVQALRGSMKKEGIDIYIVTCGDFHGSEYYSAYFNTQTFLTGFTGEGDLNIAVVTADKAALWVDGRYHLQAERELEGSGFTLNKIGLAGVISLQDFLKEEMPEGGTLGFDGRIVPLSKAEAWRKALAAKNISVKADKDLVGELWADRPAQEFHKAFLMPEEIAGESAKDKIARVRSVMKEKGATMHLITSLSDIAWLLNVRGSDVPCNPVVFSFLLMTEKEVTWYVTEDALDESVRGAVAAAGVSVKPYEAVWEDLKQLPAGTKLLVDGKGVCAYAGEAVKGKAELITAVNPTTLMKCVKTEAEQKALRIAHHKDGIAMVNFLYWLAHHPDVESLSEIDASDYLEKCRREQGAFDLSFETIAAMGPNAAMAHYAATAENFDRLKKKGFFLVDSGGQYQEGTTDITRTIAMGPLTEAQRHHYTSVLRSNMRLAAAVFPEGICGCHLDVLARQPMWNDHIDYRHGTGHGVGFCLNVHEDPNAFRITIPDNKDLRPAFVPGMVTTDEPGFYVDNEYGIRIENELLCVADGESEYGRYLRFESLTLCPIDLTPVNKDEMAEQEIADLNAYHARVYEELKDDLKPEVAAWLCEVTRPL